MFPARFRLALAVLALLSLPPVSRSQPAGPPTPIRASTAIIDEAEGNWELSSTNTPEPGKTERSYVSLRRTRQLLHNGEPMTPGGGFSNATGSNWTWQLPADSDWLGYRADSLFYSAGGFVLTGYWGRVQIFRPISRNEMRGTWKHGGASGEDTWRRLIPHVTQLEFIGLTTNRAAFGERPGRLHVKYEAGDGMRGNKSEFEINIFGENLWGYHYATIEGTDIEAYWLNPITDPKANSPEKVVGVRLRGYTWSKATPGIKRIHLDDLVIPFQLDLEGAPKPSPAAPSKPRDPLALEGEQVVGVSTDPQTGDLRIVRRNADGSTTVTTGKRTLAPDGTERIVELDEQGHRRETTIAPDGTTTITRSDDRATKFTTTFTPDGSVTTLEQEAGGASTSSRCQPDGSVTTEKRDHTGALIATTRERPDGTVERVDPEGNVTTVTTDDQGRSTAVSTDRDGNVLTVVTNRAGGEESRERIVTRPLEPGRAYFEDVLKGTDWNSLPASLKHRYADSESQLHETALRHAEEDATLAKQRAEEIARQASDAKGRAATAGKLAAIRAEQEAADLRAAELHAQEDRRRQVEAALDKGKELQRSYYEAVARGDRTEANRITKLQNEHEAATMALLQPTAAETSEMLRVDGVREALQRQIRERALNASIGDLAYDEAAQNTKDSITNVTRFGSIGSQMQHETSRNTRSAQRQETAARATLAEIDRMLMNDGTTREQRKILEEMRDSAAVQQEGASELLAANTRISAAGYAIDAALLVSGGTLAKGAAGAIGRTAGVIAGEGAERAAVTVLNRSALEVAGKGATSAATTVATRVGGEEAGKKIATVLAADVSTPAAQAAQAAAERLVGKKATDATVAFATRAAEVATTKVSDVPGLIRDAATGRTAAAEARAATASAAIDTAATPRTAPSASPMRPVDGHYTPQELETLHEPGRNLTPEEIQRKAELYSMRARAQKSAVQDIIDGKPVSEIEGPAVEYRNINNAINDARAAHGLPPIAPPRAPVAGPARSLLPPVAEAKPISAASSPVNATTIIERPPTGTPTVNTAAETVFERPPSPTTNIGSQTEATFTPPRPSAAPRSAPYTPEELASLHEPGKNLTPAEMQRKAEFYEMRAAAQRNAVDAVAAGKSAAEFERAAAEFRKLNDATNQARAVHGLPPINPPRAPAAGPARSLLNPPAEIKPTSAPVAARDAGATTIIEPGVRPVTERIVPTPPTATAREASVSTIILPAERTGAERIAPAASGASAREAGATTIIEPARGAASERIAPRPSSPPEPAAAPRGTTSSSAPAAETPTLPPGKTVATPPAHAATAPPPPPPPLKYIPRSFDAPTVVGTPLERERVGNLMRREWERILLRREVNQLPGQTNEAANALLKIGPNARFPSTAADLERFGETVGKIERSADGKFLTVTRSHLDGKGVISGTTRETIPIERAPVDFQLPPGGHEDFIYTNVSREGG